MQVGNKSLAVEQRMVLCLRKQWRLNKYRPELRSDPQIATCNNPFLEELLQCITNLPIQFQVDSHDPGSLPNKDCQMSEPGFYIEICQQETLAVPSDRGDYTPLSHCHMLSHNQRADIQPVPTQEMVRLTHNLSDDNCDVIQSKLMMWSSSLDIRGCLLHIEERISHHGCEIKLDLL